MTHSLYAQHQNAVGTPDGVSVPTPAVVNLVLHLLAVRGAVRVGLALNEVFPSEDALHAFFNEPSTIECLQAFVDVQDDIAGFVVQHADLDEPALAALIRQHHGRALESVDLLAEQIGVPADDLFAFLLRA